MTSAKCPGLLHSNRAAAFDDTERTASALLLMALDAADAGEADPASAVAAMVENVSALIPPGLCDRCVQCTIASLMIALAAMFEPGVRDNIRDQVRARLLGLASN